MGRYNFRSTGAAAFGALEDFFVKQALEERQRMLDEQAKAEQAAQIRQRDEALAQGAKRDEFDRTRFAAEEADRTQRRRTEEAGIARSMMSPGPKRPGELDVLRNTPYGVGIVDRGTLPSSRWDGSQSDPGGEMQTILEPTAAEAQAAGKRQAVAGIMDLLIKQGGPRNEIAAAMTGINGQVPTGILDEDPAAADARENAYRLQEIEAQNRARMREIGAQNAGQAARAGAATAKTAAEAEAAEKAAEADRAEIGRLTQDLVNNPGILNNLTGPADAAFPGMMAAVNPNTAQARAKLNSLIAKLALDRARQKLKGQGTVTDAERQIIKDDVAAELDPKVGFEALKSRLEAIGQTYGGVTAASAPAEVPRPVAGQRNVGDVVTVRGQRVRITQVNPDGTFQGEPVR